MNGLGSRIKELRISKNLLQKDLAKYLGVSQQLISFFEDDSNPRIPDANQIKKLCELFNVSADYILNINNTNTISKMIFNAKQSLSWEQLSENIATKLNNPELKNILSPNILKNLALKQESTSYEILYFLQQYFNNDNNNCFNNSEFDEITQFSLNPENKKYIEYAKKLKDKGYDPDDIVNVILKSP